MKKSPVKDLLDHLKNVSTLPLQSPFNEIDKNDLRNSLTKQVRKKNWRTGAYHETYNVAKLPAGDIDNWQILKANMSERSYQFPQNYHGLKVPSVGKQFTKYDSRGKDGKMAYLYEGDLKKIQRIRSNLNAKSFKRTNTIRSQLFGFPPQYNIKKLRPISLQTLKTKTKIEYI